MNQKIWVANLNLIEMDREISLSHTEWLTDSLINVAQQLHRNEFPDLPGLQNITISQVINFGTKDGEFLQILQSPPDYRVTFTTKGLQHPNITLTCFTFHLQP